MNPVKGFTLIELIITIAISAILLGLALPSYQQYRLRSHRSEGLDGLLNTAVQMEKTRLINRRYASMETRLTTTGKYQIEVSVSDDGNEYFLSSIPQLGQREDSCGTLTLNNLSQQGSSDNDTRCWHGR